MRPNWFFFVVLLILNAEALDATTSSPELDSSLKNLMNVLDKTQGATPNPSTPTTSSTISTSSTFSSSTTNYSTPAPISSPFSPPTSTPAYTPLPTYSPTPVTTTLAPAPKPTPFLTLSPTATSTEISTSISDYVSNIMKNLKLDTSSYTPGLNRVQGISTPNLNSNGAINIMGNNGGGIVATNRSYISPLTPFTYGVNINNAPNSYIYTGYSR